MVLEHGQVVINLCDDEDEVLPQRKSQPSVKQRSKETRSPLEMLDLSRSPERDVGPSHARRLGFQSSAQVSNTNHHGPRKWKFETSDNAKLDNNSRQSDHLTERAISKPLHMIKSTPIPRLVADTAPGSLKSQKRSRENADPPPDSGRPDKRQRSIHEPGKSSQNATNDSIATFYDKDAKRSGWKSPSTSRSRGNHEVVDLTGDAEVATTKVRDRVASGPVANGRRRGPAYGESDNRAQGNSLHSQKSGLAGGSLHAIKNEAEECSTCKTLSESRSSPPRREPIRPSAFQKDGSEGITTRERGLEIPESPLGTTDNDEPAAKHAPRDSSDDPGEVSATFFKAAPKAVIRLASESSTGSVGWQIKRALPLTPSESSADEEARSKEWSVKRIAPPAQSLSNNASQNSRSLTSKEGPHGRASQRPDTDSTRSASRQSTSLVAQPRQHLQAQAMVAKDAIIKDQSIAEKVQDTSSVTQPLTRPTKGISKTPGKPKEACLLLQQAQKNTESSSSNIRSDKSFTPLASEMSNAKNIERVMGHCLDELHRDNEHWTRIELQRARCAPEGRQIIAPDEPTSLFSRMKPLVVRQNDRKKADKMQAKFETESARGSRKSTWLTPYTTFNTDEEDVPPYSHFVKLKHNFLASNETTLHHWPYFDDETNSRPQFGDQFKPLYKMDMAFRESKLLLMIKAENFAEQAEHMLQEVQCEWADVLHFLLDPTPDVGIDLEAGNALLSRDASGEVKAFRESKRWAAVRSRLPEAIPVKTARVALLCEQFYKLAGFSFWHVARRSDYTRLLLEGKAESHNLDELTCRVCMRLSCPYHGEIEDPDENSDSEGGFFSAEHSDVETDIINPKKKNYRTRVGLPAALEADTATGKDRRHLHYWQSGQNANLFAKADERYPFYPCHHPGQSCSGAQCSCHKNKVPCEKSCACSNACTRKFQGCNCAKKGKVCFNADSCACFQLGRECDPDLCGTCGVCDVLDPFHSHDDRVLVDRCRNANIQRGCPKHTMLGKSTVHGLGLYACESIREHEFIGEYKGELITSKESERRGAVYEHQKLSYLFTLNKSQEVDSTFFGNKMRFINHATKAICNVYARIIMVNTVHRISLFAGRDIDSGEELFFNYGPMFFISNGREGGGKGNKTKDGSQSKAVPHVRNANLTKSFFDPDLEGDERGARAAQKSHGRPPRPDEGRATQIRRILSSPSDAEMADPDDDDDDYEEADMDDEDDDLYR